VSMFDFSAVGHVGPTYKCGVADS